MSKDFEKIKKEDLPFEVLRMLGIENPQAKVNSKNTPSGGGGTTNKDAWILVARRIEELIAEGKLAL